MTERAPATIECGITLDEVVARIEKKGSAADYLDSIFSDNPNYPARRQEMVGRVNSFLELFDITEQNWRQQLLAAKQNNSGYNLEIPESVLSPGDALVAICYCDFDIEGYESGYGGGALSFKSSAGYNVEVRASGDFWTDRSYTNTNNGLVFWSGDISLEQEAEVGSREDFTIDAEIDYQIGVSYFVSRLETK